jgi:hypothetical protein
MQNNGNNTNRFSSAAFFTLFLTASITTAFAQERDSAFIDPYTGMVTARAFLSQKYTIFGLQGSQGFRAIQYRPNTDLSIGVGATYRALTLNFGYGFSFLNPDSDKGETRYIDLQTHIYGVKWRFDLFGQLYRGYYMYPRGFASADLDEFYKRPDLRVFEAGGSAFHIYNNKRFSYRAAFLQSEWQKKSAGSFLLGGGATIGNVRADSAFVPASLAASYLQRDIKELRYIELGPGLGYAYTYVWRENWFVTACATLSLDFGFLKEVTAASSKSSLVLSPNFLFRFGLGYNGGDWNANFSWVSNRTALTGQYPKGGYNVNTGNYRFTVAKRFVPGAGLKKLLKPVDDLLDR